MTRLPEVKPMKIEKVLLSQGFVSRPGKGSHTVFKHKDGRRTVVPVHSIPVRIGTLRAILRQAKISVNEFIEMV